MAELIEIPQNNDSKETVLDVMGRLFGTNTTEESDITQLFTKLIALPEDEFKIISPVILDTYRNSINNPNDLMIIAQSMNLNGAKLEDMEVMINEILSQIEEMPESQMSSAKKDFFKDMVNSLYNALASVESIGRRIIKVPIELCRETAKIPQYAHLTDAGADVYAAEDVDIAPGETKIVPLGFKMALPSGYAVLIHPRSGLSVKSKMRVANSIGLCDSDYRDEYGIILENIEPKIKDITTEFDEETQTYKINSIVYGSTIHITQGERIGQLRLVEVPHMAFYEIDDISVIGSDRGGGFGSTGET
jgi:dUTP pyrophosphatase